MATRFQSLNDQEIRDKIAYLVDQLSAGTAQVTINGITTVLSRPENIRLMIAEFEAELTERAVAKIGGARRSPLSPQYPKMTAGKGYL
ncbi:hypothetical protein [Roseovarius indicus]|uniref:hypothetical protein n=1 Tax=Roseovarius indicus TaxID=540747 RepID=UPI004059F0B3